MLSSEETIVLSMGGSLAVAALPKLIDLFFGDRIAKRNKQLDSEAAYRQRVFDDATAVRLQREDLLSKLQERNEFLEKRNRELEGATWPPQKSSGRDAS